MVKLVTQRGWRTIEFTAPDGKPATIPLGQCDRGFAMYIRKRVGELLDAAQAGVAPPRQTVIWLGSVLGSPLFFLLAKAGLCLFDEREQARRIVERLAERVAP